MWDILNFLHDVIVEINTTLPWLYRGWAFLLSGKYQAKCRREWKRQNIFSMTLDILVSLAFMAVEGIFVYYLYVELTT